jgi:hypothetical protein
MRLPILLRTDHEEQVRLFNVIIDSHLSTIEELKFKLQQRDNEIENLMSELTGEAPARIPKEHKSRSLTVLPGRSGWRAKAQARSRATIPPPKDSAKALEDKVIREGGKV